MQRVVIVGSRVPRLDAETALPVQVIERAQIERLGVFNAEELLDRVSANFGGQREALGLGNGDTPGLSAASLHGLGPGETLVLLNGRRLANYAFTGGTGAAGVDLHAIPMAAIERVELLKDGASAIYGSDAIGGVINFVTRTDFHGAEGSLQASLPEAGGGERGRVTLSWGQGELARDGHNLFAVLDLQRAATLLAADRAFASTGVRPDLGLDGSSPSAFPANVVLVYGRPTPVSMVNPTSPDCPAPNVAKGSSCWYDFPQRMALQSPSWQANGLLSGSRAFDGGFVGHVEAAWARNRIAFAAAESPTRSTSPSPASAYRLPADSPYYPTALAAAYGLSGDLSLFYRTTALGPRRSQVDTVNTRLLVGLEGPLSESWDADVAVVINDTRSRESYLSGFVGAQRLREALATGLVNPFGPSAAAGQALLESTQIRGTAREARGQTLGADLRLTGDGPALPGGPLGLALGVDLRHERLEDLLRPFGDDVVGGYEPASKAASRNVAAVFAEAVAPLAPGLEAQLALRTDHYSDFGSATSPKLALRWQPGRRWLLRASAGQGFRAPSLPEAYTAQQRSTGPLLSSNGEFVPDPLRCPATGQPSDCAPEVVVVSGGNPDVGPQRSVQSGLGVVLMPAPQARLSLDLWRTRVQDLIGALPLTEVTDHLSRYEQSNVRRGPPEPAQPGLPGPIREVLVVNQNLGDWTVDGADLGATLGPWATPLGALQLQFDGSYVRRARQALYAGYTLELIGAQVPRWQHVLSATLQHAGLSATLIQRYRRGYDDERLLPDGSVHRVSPYRVWDAQLAWSVSAAWKLTLGVRNLLDDEPPATSQQASFQVGYDPRYADPYGRTWTIGLLAGFR